MEIAADKRQLDESGEWSYHMPPRSMIKCLKFLPLCYAADGIIDFCAASDLSKIIEDGHWVTPLRYDQTSDYNKYNNLIIPEHLSAYSMITDANSKIALYGKIIKPLNWLNANRIMTSGISSILPDDQDWINLSTLYLDDLRVNNPDSLYGNYQGYVQCGYYTDNRSYPSFMLVNRRAVDELPEGQIPASAELSDVDLFYIDAPSQILRFTPATSADAFFGIHTALYDPYDRSLFKEDGSHIPVPIGPGDGRLLHMCCTLPSTVDSSQTLNHLVYLRDQITLADGAQVTISAGSETHVLSNTSIHIPAGCAFTFRGNVDFGDSVHIYVEPEGSLYFEDAVCTWGENSAVEVENGNLHVNGGNWDTEADATSWGGIRASASSDITLIDVVISKAYYNSVNNSDLEVTNCRFNVPSDGFGLLISNSTEGYSTWITNNESGKGFFGNTYQNTRGIVLGSTKNPVILDSVYFNNLMTGIWKSSNVSVRDSITGCTFSNCNTGINIISSDYVGLIESCNFNQTIQDSTAAGIRLIAANPRISECDFHTYRGIVTEYSIDTFSRDSGIFDCDFIQCNTGIESRGSNHRLERNYFNYPDTGIVCHAKSNLNLQDTANNVLNCRSATSSSLTNSPMKHGFSYSRDTTISIIWTMATALLPLILNLTRSTLVTQHPITKSMPAGTGFRICW
jgi:hypothetical protein